MRTRRLSTPKSNNGVPMAVDGVASYKATMCDKEYDYLSTGEPITLNFEALGLNLDHPTPIKLAEDDRSSLGGSRQNDLIEGEADGGEKARSRSPQASPGKQITNSIKSEQLLFLLSKSNQSQ